MIRPAPLLSHLVPLPIPLPRVETFDWQSAEAMASLAAVSKFRLVMLSSKAVTWLCVLAQASSRVRSPLRRRCRKQVEEPRLKLEMPALPRATSRSGLETAHNAVATSVWKLVMVILLAETLSFRRARASWEVQALYP